MQDASAQSPNPPQPQVTSGPGPQQPSAVLLASLYRWVANKLFLPVRSDQPVSLS